MSPSAGASGAGPTSGAARARVPTVRSAAAGGRRGASEPRALRRALVTGGAVRVGRAIALALAEAGYDLVIHYHRSAREARAVAAQARRRGVRAAPARADLSDPAEIPALFDLVARELGGLDLLVNSAATFPHDRPERVTAAQWDRVFSLNARAPFLCAQAAARLMGDRGGSIVNIADVAAFEAWPGYVPYAASKAAVVSVTRGLALAWAPRIRVNAVAPGPVLLPVGTPAEEAEATARLTALGRLGSPEDVAQAVLYLAGAEFVTGEVIRVDGGKHLK